MIALDVRGFCQSTKFSREGTYGRSMADDVIHLLDNLDIRRAHLVGHSMGALIAANVFERYPNRVISAALLAGPFWQDSAAAAADLRRWETELDAGRGLTALFLGLVPGMDAATAQGLNHDIMAASDESTLRAVLPPLGALTVGLNRAPGLPVLIAAGGRDPLSQYSHALASHWTRVRMLDLPAANHMTIVGQPQVLAGIRQLMHGQPN